MLTPEYLGNCTDYLLALYDGLEEQILQDIARRIVKTGELTDTADWQYKQLQEMGALQESIYKRLAEISGKSDAEIRRLFEESAYQNITTNAAPLISHGISAEIELSAPMRQILEANIIRTSGNIKNLTRTIGSTGSMTYYDISNQAFMQAMSGAFSPDYAIREAIRRLGGSGVTVMFPGRKDKLDVAIRRNVRTSVAQTAATITMMQSLQMGVQYYETTAHIGARPEHAVWQGRVFKIEGSDPDHENFYDATQYGTAGGLCGVNCRHQFFPFWPGISKPAYSKETLDHYNNATVTYNGEEIPYYVATQMQRAMERGIRDTKRKIVVADAAAEAATEESVRNAVGEMAQKQRNVLKKQRGVLTDFCAQTGLTKDSARVSVPEHGRRTPRNYARIIDLVTENGEQWRRKYNVEKIIDGVRTSQVGRDSIAYIEENNVSVKVDNISFGNGARGESDYGWVKLYTKNISSEMVAQQSLVHEATHLRFDIGNCQHAEAICFSFEKMHKENRDYLTRQEWEKMVELAKMAYPEYDWERGGYGDYGQFHFVRG